MRTYFFKACLALWFGLFAISATAQSLVQLDSGSSESTLPVIPEVLTEDAARELLSTLSDTEVRQLLLDRLDAVAAEQAATTDAQGGLSELITNATAGVGRSVTGAIARVPIIGESFGQAFAQFRAETGPNGLTFMILVMGISALIALAVELLFRRSIRNWVASVSAATGETSLRNTLSFLGKRLTADVVAVIIFFGVARMVGPFVAESFGPLLLESQQQGQNTAKYLLPLWFNFVMLPRIAAATGRFFMAPKRPEYRMIFVDDATARGLYRHQIVIALLLGLTFWAPGFMNTAGVPFGTSRLGFWLNLALHLYFMWMAWHYRSALSLMMRGPDPNVTKGEASASRAYPVFLFVATALTWWLVEILAAYGRFDLIGNLPHIWMLILVSFAPAMDTMVRSLVRHMMPPMSGEGPVAERAYHATRRSYIRIGRVIVFAVVILAITIIWQLDLTNLAAASVGAQLAGRLIELMMVLAIGYLVYEVVSLYINRKLAAEITATGYDPENSDFGGDGGGTGGSRLSTVLPLILATSRVTIVVLFVLLGLSNVGVDTTPLLAGAGIVGLAIGFGAQKLVTDVVSGIFFLVDDAFRTGEYVEIEGTFGTVEKISIRSMQLRHHKGPVHTIPYGEIPKITNYSRDWVIMKLRFTVPFDTDPNKVKKIFKKIGAEMLDHPDLGQDFLQPFKSQGVLEIDDVGMVIRGKFMAKPGKQFMIRKEIFNRVSAAFGENNIDFARREVRVAIPSLDGKEGLTEEDKAAIAAAASSAADAAQAQEGAPSQNDR